jgi:uncharacterized protein (TIGR02246 family)
MSDTMTLPRRDAALAAALGAMAAATPALAAEDQAGRAAEVEALKALIDAHDKAFNAHDLKGVLALFTPNATILGTGPGEIWGGAEEIGTAYGHFFEGFDAGKQKIESLWRDGHVIGEMAWLMAVTNVTMTKAAATSEAGINLLVVFEKMVGKWLIRVMHFSNLTTGGPPAGK